MVSVYLLISPVSVKLCSVRSFFCLKIPQLGFKSASFVNCSTRSVREFKDSVESKIILNYLIFKPQHQ